MSNINIYNGDCIDQKRLPDESVDLGIFDPPFGLGESGFNKHYKRDSSNVLNGYEEAPSDDQEDYQKWTADWLSEAKRVLKPNGSMYVFMGHTNLRCLLNAAHDVGLHEINHLIWKYNFGVYTKKKYVTSHYHVLYYSKSPSAQVTFNLHCRFGSANSVTKSGSDLYTDLEDVFRINKDYSPGQKKNQNKLPDEIIRKIILYSSNQNDVVCDFFMGNFTTAKMSISLGRAVSGYEKNSNSYDHHMPLVNDLVFGYDLDIGDAIESGDPENQGKTITPEEATSICRDYVDLCDMMSRSAAKSTVEKKYKRGRFSIKNVLDKHLDEYVSSLADEDVL